VGVHVDVDVGDYGWLAVGSDSALPLPPSRTSI